MKNFKQWLLHQRKRIGPVGDLARDFRYDLRDTNRRPGEEPLPRRLTTRAIKAYLESRGACDGALAALDDAIGEWNSLTRQEQSAI